MKILLLVAISLLAFNQAALSSDTTSAGSAKSSPGERKPVPQPDASKPASPAVAADYGKLPLSFEANRGQSDPQVRFTSRGSGYSLFLTDSVAVLALTKGNAASNGNQNKLSAAGKKPASGSKPFKTEAIPMELAGASHDLRVTGADQLPGTANYFIGNDSKKWHSQVPTYAKVKYSGVYSGVDLVYYGNQRQLEYDFVVAPHADPNSIRLHFAGAKKISLNANGDLAVAAAEAGVVFRLPEIYQVVDGKRVPVTGQFALFCLEVSHACVSALVPCICDPAGRCVNL